MAWSPTDLVSVAKVTGIASSGIFAGYTWALSDAAVPAILAAKDEVTMAKQWRIQYVRGFILAVPATIINIFSWGLLAYATAITTGSGTVFAWTALRHINGALSIRSAKIAGPWTGFGSLPLTYSAKEKRSIDTENKYSTAELMVMWKNYNLARSVVLLVGTLIGAYALAFANSLTE
ncbi:hypothetical protein EG328_000281 [Venturia inaequalis]|uniref:DUF1772-domain-containing protein n=1 Tax=Venturia inaequalis TaxID=5025 RepID=A0A8H3UZX5_VENIN|nr:hypothetical protein EG328_000281 [Venturia inaequalis]